MSSITSLLKQTREWIQKQEYKEALKCCKKVLQQDKNNYNVFIFIGFCSEKLNQIEQAEQAYQKAIEIDSGNTNGWKGLAELYESHWNDLVQIKIQKKRQEKETEGEMDEDEIMQIEETTRRELEKIFCQTLDKLLAIEKDANKWKQYASRLVQFPMEGEEEKNIEILQRLQHMSSDPKEIQERKFYLIELLKQLQRQEESEVHKFVLKCVEEKIQELRNEWEAEMLKTKNYTRMELQRLAPKDEQLITQYEIEELKAKKKEDCLIEFLSQNIRTKWDDTADLLLSIYDTTKSTDLPPLQVYLSIIERNFKRYKQLRDEKLRKETIKKCFQLLDFHKISSYALEMLITFSEEDDSELDPKEVFNLKRKIVHSHPYEGVSSILLAEMLIEKNKDCKKDTFQEEIEVILMKGLEANPHFISGWIIYHKLATSLEKYKKALDCANKGLHYLKQRVNMHGSKLNNMETKLLLLTANSMLHLDLLDKSEEIFKSILQKNRKDVEALSGLAEVAFFRNDLNTCSKLYQLVIKNDENNHSALSQLGWIQFLQGNYDTARQYLLNAIQICSDRYIYSYRLGRVYWEMGKVKQYSHYRMDKKYCYQAFMNAAKLNPNFPSTFTYLGHYFKDITGDIEMSMKCYRKAVQLNPMESDAGEILADYYQERGLHTLAVQLFRDATSKNSRCIWAWKRLGFYNQSKSDFEEALLCFQHTLKIEQKDASCWEGLAETYQKQGKYLAALKAFVHAEELDASRVYSSSQIAFIRELLGEKHEAHMKYEQIVESNPSYIPAYKGLAEVLFSIANDYFKDGLFTKSAFQLAKSRSVLLNAIKIRGDMFSLWKLLGDVQSFFYYIPEQYISQMVTILNGHKKRSSIPSIYLNEHREKKIEYLRLGSIAYQHCVFLKPSDPDSWYDLGVNLFYQCQCVASISAEQISVLRSQSLRGLKVAISLSPNTSRYWNVLACVETKPQIRQHAFIRSLQLDSKNHGAWSNLGAFYLEYNEFDLAKEAFLNAQNLDPSNCLSWIGLAIINENVVNRGGFKRAKSAFKHATSLENSVAAFIGLAYTSFASGDMLQTMQSLMKYIQFNEFNPEAWNLLGLTFEVQKKYVEAERALTSAIKLLKGNVIDDNNDKNGQSTEGSGMVIDTPTIQFSRIPLSLQLNYVKINYARILQQLKRYEESYNTLREVKSQKEFKEDIGVDISMSMTCLHIGKYEECVGILQQLCTRLKDSPNSNNNNNETFYEKTLILLGKVYYKLHDYKQSKSCFEQCIKQFPNSIDAYQSYAVLCALSNQNKPETSLDILKLMKQRVVLEEKEWIETYRLECSIYMCLGYFQKAKYAISKAIHMYPHQAYLWDELAAYLLSSLAIKTRSQPVCEKETVHIPPATISQLCSQLLSTSFSRVAQDTYNNDKDSYVNRLYTISAMYYVMGIAPGYHNAEVTIRYALRMIQKVLMIDPCHQDARKLLTYCTHAMCNICSEDFKTEASITMLKQYLSLDDLHNSNQVQEQIDLLWIHVALSEDYIKRKQFKESMEHITKILEKKHDLLKLSNTEDSMKKLLHVESVLHVAMGKNLKAQNAKASEVMKCFENAFKTDTGNLYAWLSLADIFVQERKLNAAERCLKMCEYIVNSENEQKREGSLMVPNRTALQFVVYVKLALLYYELQNVKDGISYVNNAIKLNDSSPVAFFIQGKLYLKSNDLKRAERSFMKSMKFDQKQPLVSLGLYDVHYRQEAWESAEHFAFNEKNIMPNCSYVYYVLSMYAFESQVVDAAHQMIQKAIHLEPSRMEYWQYLKHIEHIIASPEYQQQLQYQNQPEQQETKKKKEKKASTSSSKSDSQQPSPITPTTTTTVGVSETSTTSQKKAKSKSTGKTSGNKKK